MMDAYDYVKLQLEVDPTVPLKNTFRYTRDINGRWTTTKALPKTTIKTKFSALHGSKTIMFVCPAVRKVYATMHPFLITTKMVSCSTPITSVCKAV